MRRNLKLVLATLAAAFLAAPHAIFSQPSGLGPSQRYYYFARGPNPVRIEDGGTGARSAKLARTQLSVPGTEDAETITGNWTFEGTVAVESGVLGVGKAGVRYGTIYFSNPAGNFTLGLTAPAVGGSRTISLPDPGTSATTTLVCEDLIQTLTNKTIALGSNTVSGTKAQLNTAVTDDDPAYVGTIQTFTTTQTFQPGTDVVGMKMIANTGYAANAMELRDESNVLYWKMGPSGITYQSGFANFAETGADLAAAHQRMSMAVSSLTLDRTATWPNVSGTVPLLSSLPGSTGLVAFASGTAGQVATDSDLSFAVDSIVVTKARVATSLRLGTDATITALGAGTWTATRSAESNLDGNVTVTEGQWQRVGNTVTVSMRFTADPTAAGAASFELTLPVASNFGAAEDAAGAAFSGGIAGQGAEVTGSVANNTLVISWIAVDTTSQTWSLTATYQVI